MQSNARVSCATSLQPLNFRGEPPKYEESGDGLPSSRKAHSMAQGKEFAVGTIVKLKSGGPDMTIKEVFTNFEDKKPTGSYKCQWFAGKKLEDGNFPGDSLELVPPQPKAP